MRYYSSLPVEDFCKTREPKRSRFDEGFVVYHTELTWSAFGAMEDVIVSSEGFLIYVFIDLCA